MNSTAWTKHAWGRPSLGCCRANASRESGGRGKGRGSKQRRGLWCSAFGRAVTPHALPAAWKRVATNRIHGAQFGNAALLHYFVTQHLCGVPRAHVERACTDGTLRVGMAWRWTVIPYTVPPPWYANLNPSPTTPTCCVCVCVCARVLVRRLRRT